MICLCHNVMITDVGIKVNIFLLQIIERKYVIVTRIFKGVCLMDFANIKKLQANEKSVYLKLFS